MPFTPLNGPNDMQKWGAATDMLREIYAREIVEIYKDESGVRRVLIGKGAGGFYGLKVSKPTFDVYTATDDQLIFNSSQNVLKVAISDTYTFPAIASIPAFDNELQQVTIPHNLGFFPANMLFAQLNKSAITQISQFPSTYYTEIGNGFGTNDSTGVDMFNSFYAGVDDTNIYLSREAINNGASPLGASAIPIKYLLLQESAI